MISWFKNKKNKIKINNSLKWQEKANIEEINNSDRTTLKKDKPKKKIQKSI